MWILKRCLGAAKPYPKGRKCPSFPNKRKFFNSLGKNVYPVHIYLWIPEDGEVSVWDEWIL